MDVVLRFELACILISVSVLVRYAYSYVFATDTTDDFSDRFRVTIEQQLIRNVINVTTASNYGNG